MIGAASCPEKKKREREKQQIDACQEVMMVSTKKCERGRHTKESSHVLWITRVFFPPMKISLVYSSIALFESAT